MSNYGKVMLEILQARLQKYMNQNLQMLQAGFSVTGTQVKFPRSTGSLKSKRIPV